MPEFTLLFPLLKEAPNKEANENTRTAIDPIPERKPRVNLEDLLRNPM